MSDKKEIVIKDACILFDLVDLNLLEDFFQLEVEAFTTSQVTSEITNEDQWEAISKFINNGKLRIDDSGTLEAISRINDEYPGLSLPDSSVLELAIRKNVIVRGIIWVIAELHALELLTSEAAIEKLCMYEKINQRAPLKEIKKLMDKLISS